ncbi:MAG TPA: hypothetical protein VIK20_05980 [Bacteroidales bacterium]
MHKYIFISLLSLVCSSIVFAAGETLPYKTDVTIDGINKEWSPRLPKFDKSTGINYSVANDERNLYFILRIADEATQRRIVQNGMEVWINSLGKKRKVTGVTFPLPMSKDLKKDTPEQKQRTPQVGQEMSFLTRELILTGFLLENGKQPTEGCPIRVSLSRDESKCMVYELAVPFNTFYKESLDQSDAAVKFCFGFIIKGTESTNKVSDIGGMGGYGGMGGMGGYGGMGGPGGMGGHGGMEMSGQQGRNDTSVPDKTFWFKTLLNIK